MTVHAGPRHLTSGPPTQRTHGFRLGLCLQKYKHTCLFPRCRRPVYTTMTRHNLTPFDLIALKYLFPLMSDLCFLCCWRQRHTQAASVQCAGNPPASSTDVSAEQNVLTQQSTYNMCLCMFGFQRSFSPPQCLQMSLWGWNMQ